MLPCCRAARGRAVRRKGLSERQDCCVELAERERAQALVVQGVGKRSRSFSLQCSDVLLGGCNDLARLVACELLGRPKRVYYLCARVSVAAEVTGFGYHERRASELIQLGGVGPMANQQLSDRARSCCVQRRGALRVRQVGIGTPREQALDTFEMTLLARENERSVTKRAREIPGGQCQVRSPFVALGLDGLQHSQLAPCGCSACAPSCHLGHEL